jgi:hypothetical protein
MQLLGAERDYSMNSRKSRPARYIILAIVICVVSFGSGALLGIQLQPQLQNPEISVASDSGTHEKRMSACVDRTFDKLKPAKLNVGLFERVWRLCGNERFNALYLEDFLIRREKFLRQYLDERVTLWLVVSITISGIVLAAIQLFMSFRLALAGNGELAKDSEFALENTKLSIKSSITGAVILALSLAFFMVYVIWIYTIREVPVEKPGNLQTPSEWNNPLPAAETGAPNPNNPPSNQNSDTK